ncbi:MAG TPA: TolC family protein [Thermoanaerobaculia bacterium]
MPHPRTRLLAVLPALLLALPTPCRAEEGLTFDEALSRRRPTALEAGAAALLAEARRQAAGGGGLAAEGPSLALTGGPRRGEDGGTAGDFAVEVELPLAGGRGARGELAEAVAATADDLLAGARALAGADLAAAFVDAWLAQQVIAVRAEDLAASEEQLTLARRRVEAGADPPYEPVLVAGERDRALVELVAARREAELAWGALAERAEVGAEPRPLTLGGLPGGAGAADGDDPAALAPSGGSEGDARDGPAFAALEARRRLESALARARAGAARSRWAVATEIESEGDERAAHVGVAYRFPLPGERAGIAAEAAAAEASAERAARAEAAALRARVAAARTALAAAAPTVGAGELERARSALAVRVAEGKERPSAVLPLRRQLLEARLAALAARATRARAAAELHFLTGDGPHAR